MNQMTTGLLGRYKPDPQSLLLKEMEAAIQNGDLQKFNQVTLEITDLGQDAVAEARIKIAHTEKWPLSNIADSVAEFLINSRHPKETNFHFLKIALTGCATHEVYNCASLVGIALSKSLIPKNEKDSTPLLELLKEAPSIQFAGLVAMIDQGIMRADQAVELVFSNDPVGSYRRLKEDTWQTSSP